MEATIYGLGFRAYSPPLVDRIWKCQCHNEIPCTPYSICLRGPGLAEERQGLGVKGFGASGLKCSDLRVLELQG